MPERSLADREATDPLAQSAGLHWRQTRGESIHPHDPMMKAHKLAAGLLGWSVLQGCSVPPPRYPIRESNSLLGALQQREQRVQSLHARGSADHFGAQGRVRGSIMLWVRRPDRLRIDAFAFGTMISSVVSDGTTFSLMQGHDYYVGPAAPCIAQRLLGIAMSGADVVTALTGGAPLLGQRSSAVRWEDGRYVFDVEGTDGLRQRLEFELPSAEREQPAEQQHPLLRRVVVRDREGLRAEITYDNYRVVEGTSFPERVRFVMPRDRVDTQLRFDLIEPNFRIPEDPTMPGPPPDPFERSAPAGITPSPINC